MVPDEHPLGVDAAAPRALGEQLAAGRRRSAGSGPDTKMGAHPGTLPASGESVSYKPQTEADSRSLCPFPEPTMDNLSLCLSGLFVAISMNASWCSKARQLNG